MGEVAAADHADNVPASFSQWVGLASAARRCSMAIFEVCIYTADMQSTHM